MFSIVQEAVPADALLKTYRKGLQPERWERYSDCFTIIVNREVNLSDFVFAFYTSTIFRIERLVLRALVGTPSSRSDARAVADGTAVRFAVWYVGAHTATQLLMCDRFERTRSWFRVEPLQGGRTRLQFGSAVASGDVDANGAAADGRFSALLRFHIFYSQVLLHAATLNLR
jgi:hypothetical protein